MTRNEQNKRWAENQRKYPRDNYINPFEVSRLMKFGLNEEDAEILVTMYTRRGIKKVLKAFQSERYRHLDSPDTKGGDA